MTQQESLSLRIRDIRDLSPTLKHIVLESVDGNLLPAALPGAHVALSFAGRERKHRNSYSLVGSGHDRSRYQIIVRRVANSRGGSQHIHETLRVGDIIDASLPNSQFTLHSRARKHLLIAGGVGITPFLSFLPTLRDRGQKLEMHHFSSKDEVPVYTSLIEPYLPSEVHVHAGRSRPIAEILRHQPLGTHVYTCGPFSLMDDVEQSAAALGWPAFSIHQESFDVSGGKPFTVKLARSGLSVDVGEHQTMLEALEDAGAPIPSSCRGGACGECLTHVRDGTPDHRDHFLTSEERASGQFIMPCVSRALSSAITIDL